MDVHLRDLRYFVAVAEELHFTRAADRLFVSQPALSRQVAKLERDLRVDLLVRAHHHVELTAAGEALLARARRLLSDWEDARRATSDAAAATAAVLRVGMQTSLGRGLLPALQQQLRTTHPAWRLEVVRADWDEPTCGLADGRVDVALVWLPLPDPGRYRWSVLVTEPRHVAVATDHRLAGRTEVSLAELANEPFIALPRSAGPLRDYWLALDQWQASTPAIGGTAGNADEAFELVSVGAGVMLLARGNAELYRRDGVVDVPVTDLRPAELAIAWRADDAREVVRSLALTGLESP